jgi:hypothetical protein
MTQFFVVAEDSPPPYAIMTTSVKYGGSSPQAWGTIFLEYFEIIMISERLIYYQ